MGPWNGNDNDPTSKFPSLGPIKSDMSEVYRLFNSKADVTFCIKELIKLVSLSGKDAFRKSLSDLEKSFGFSENVFTANKQLSSIEFLSYVGAKRPILDVGFMGTTHGCCTHRIQFMMIALWKKHHPGKIKTEACEIYKAMSDAFTADAKPTSEGNYSFEHVAWNYYFDVDPVALGVNNACRPDYLCGKFLEDEFPKLHEVAS